MILWWQEDTSSLRLFSVDSSGRQMIRNFSLRQRLHLLLELLYGECDERMRQEIKCSMLLSLRVQMCLLSSVEFLCLAWRNDAVWFMYLVLKSFSVSPMYVSVVLLSLRLTVAWKITDGYRQLPLSEHAFICRQLHLLLLMVVAAAVAVSSACIDAARMRLLWLSIICFVLFMQL